jgi:hypothetical protein
MPIDIIKSIDSSKEARASWKKIQSPLEQYKTNVEEFYVSKEKMKTGNYPVELLQKMVDLYSDIGTSRGKASGTLTGIVNYIRKEKEKSGFEESEIAEIQSANKLLAGYVDIFKEAAEVFALSYEKLAKKNDAYIASLKGEFQLADYKSEEYAKLLMDLDENELDQLSAFFINKIRPMIHSFSHERTVMNVVIRYKEAYNNDIVTDKVAARFAKRMEEFGDSSDDSLKLLENVSGDQKGYVHILNDIWIQIVLEKKRRIEQRKQNEMLQDFLQAERKLDENV